MKKKRNKTQSKQQNKSLKISPKETKTYDLPNKEFKTMVLKLFDDIQYRYTTKWNQKNNSQTKWEYQQRENTIKNQTMWWTVEYNNWIAKFPRGVQQQIWSSKTNNQWTQMQVFWKYWEEQNKETMAKKKKCKEIMKYK